MNESIIKDKSFSFSIRIVRLYKYLAEKKKEYIISKQFMRSGKSVGALVREVQNTESKADFIYKLAIAQKECDETMYWVELLKETAFLNKKEFEEIYGETQELLKIIRSIILTSKQKKS
jgi:four helix bundle protein